MDALGLGYEGIRCQGPASWSDRPRPVVTDKQKETQSRLRSQNPKLGLACPGCIYGVSEHLEWVGVTGDAHRFLRESEPANP